MRNITVRLPHTLHVNDHTQRGGTSLRGHITANYKDIVARLGEPESGDGYKVDADWSVTDENTLVPSPLDRTKMVGLTATLYNWKNGPAYLGDEGTPPESNLEWNIGGNHPDAVKLIHAVLLD